LPSHCHAVGSVRHRNGNRGYRAGMSAKHVRRFVRLLLPTKGFDQRGGGWIRRTGPLCALRRRRRRRGAMLKQRASVGRVQLMPLPRLQTTRRPHFTSRRRWRVARLMLRASVGRVQLIDAAAAPADDAAARLDQNKVARREADAARRRRSRAADATATRSNVCGVVCVCRCQACRRRGGCTSRAEESGEL